MNINTQYLDALNKLTALLPKSLYLVGGALRDYFFGFEIKDFDLCGEMTPAEIILALQNSDFNIDERHKALGNLIIYQDSYRFEYTTFRKDTYSGNGAYTPLSISFSPSLEEDALRRDFTINALYYNFSTKTIVDPLNGMADIQNKILRCARAEDTVLSEDALRILRAVRIAASCGIELSENLEAAIIKYKANITNLSANKLREEFCKILLADTINNISDAHIKGINMLASLGLIGYIIPEMLEGDGLVQRKDFHKYDVLGHNIHTFYYSKPTLVLRLSGLLHDIGKPRAQKPNGEMSGHQLIGSEMTAIILKRLDFPKNIIEKVTKLVSVHMFNLKGTATNTELILFIQDNIDILEELISLKNADNYGGGIYLNDSLSAIKLSGTQKFMQKNNIPFSISELKISGIDLKGIVPDKNINSILTLVLKQTALDNTLVTRQKQLEFVENLI